MKINTGLSSEISNIVFSTLLNPMSSIGEILMNIQDDFEFFAPELLKEELTRYAAKIELFTKLNEKELQLIKVLVLDSIHFVSEDLISNSSWQSAFELTKDIDEDDTPFVALSIELSAKLWTGDKVLSAGLSKKGANLIITTKEIKNS